MVEIPRHVGIVMDGNGRWARERGLPRLAGHRAGAENAQRVLKAGTKYGVEIVTLYGFSTENWQRPEREVKGLMRIFEESIDRYLPELHRNGVQLYHLGRLEGLPKSLAEKIQEAEELTRENNGAILNLAFNYGGRAEIVDAVRRILTDGIDPQDIDEELFSRYLYTGRLPEVDLIIRTGGERRLSNFLLWQSAHAEYYSTSTYWPAFDGEELKKALRDYNRRKGRPEDDFEEFPAEK